QPEPSFGYGDDRVPILIGKVVGSNPATPTKATDQFQWLFCFQPKPSFGYGDDRVPILIGKVVGSNPATPTKPVSREIKSL
ncbi:hypothetical protein LZF95_23215, partial [Algoriphagus sp. AGSA1]|uniref:hypothetical protein n=1 Tax=Algoriphagus sp. AGSA1 TaxID=2907213 RepID=UPI001F36D0BA